MAEETNLEIKQTQTFVREITWKDALGVIIPITGCDAVFKIKSALNNGTTICESSVENGKITIQNDVLILTIPHKETKLMKFDRAWHSLVLIRDKGLSTEVVTELIYGTVSVKIGVT